MSWAWEDAIVAGAGDDAVVVGDGTAGRFLRDILLVRGGH